MTTVIGDMASGKYVVNPIVEPPTKIEYYLIHQTQRPLLRASRDLVDRLEKALKQSAAEWSGWQNSAAAPDEHSTAAD